MSLYALISAQTTLEMYEARLEHFRFLRRTFAQEFAEIVQSAKKLERESIALMKKSEDEGTHCAETTEALESKIRDVRIALMELQMAYRVFQSEIELAYTRASDACAQHKIANGLVW